MINNFENIYNNYDLFLIDVWGVVHDGYTPYPGTVKMLNKLLEEKNLFFVSNAPRPNYIVAHKLKEFGINIDDTNVITSGDVTRSHLIELANLDKVIYHLGEARNKDILQDINIQTTRDLNEADFLLLTPYLDSGEDLEQFQDLFKQAIKNQMTALCANPDVQVINGESFRYCAGYFAQQYSNLGGDVQYFGKPHKNIYQFALKQLNKNIPLNRILMVGDTIDTDILGAHQAGIHSALVLTGNSTLHFKQGNNLYNSDKINILNKLFEAHNLKPNLVIHGLF